MNFKNTNSHQNREIENARYNTDINNLIYIIEDLDKRLSEYMDVADKFGCPTPEELDKKLAEL